MSELSALRNQIRSLLWRRTVVGRAMGWSVVAAAAAWLVIAVFVIDVQLEMTRLQRLVALVASAGCMVWIIRQWVRPWLARHEDEIDVALSVEHRRHIDSDLVAALQFESARGRAWGSAQLKQAVIRQVAERTRRMDLATDEPTPGLGKRLGLAGGSVGVMVLLALVFPGYFGIFAARMAMASAVYPTDTLITQVRVNEQELGSMRTAQAVAHCPIGRAVEFTITCEGELPDSGKITVYQRDGGKTMSIVVEADSARPGGYTGRLDKMPGSIEFVASIGDARTQRGRVLAVPPPVVQPIFLATVPDYAAAAGVRPMKTGTSKRQIAVYAGARVDLKVQALNKPLDTVALVVDKTEYPLKAADADGLLWTLPPQGTPFSEIAKAVEYEIKVVDRDGLPPMDPIRGSIRLEEDRAPTVEADIARRRVVHVLPTARPRIRYLVNDDYGIGSLKMHVRIQRVDGAEEKPKPYWVLGSKEPVTIADLPLDRAYQFDLSGFGLVKGDQVEIVLEAVDYRGRRPGRATASAPLMLKVSDQSGVLDAFTSDADAESERKLRQIIQGVTGIERSKP